MSAVAGQDGKLRCPWAIGSDEMRIYHDKEWGRALKTDQAFFERMCLEAMQSGLSWAIILRKRETIRRAFAEFDFQALASYDEADVERLLQDPGIIRNRAKINAVIVNAAIAAELPKGLKAHITSFAPKPKPPRPTELAGIRSESPESHALAKDLRKRGMKFVGPTTLYALMQASGLVDDHLADCFVK